MVAYLIYYIDKNLSVAPSERVDRFSCLVAGEDCLDK